MQYILQKLKVSNKRGTFAKKQPQKKNILAMVNASTFDGQRKYFHQPLQVLAFLEYILPQFGIISLHLIPKSCTFHQSNKVVPFLLIVLTQSLCPNMSVLMDWSLCICHAWVNINLAICGKSPNFSFGSLELI